MKRVSARLHQILCAFFSPNWIMKICQILNSAVKLTGIWKEDNIELICLLILGKTAVAINLITAQDFHGLDGVIAAHSDVPGTGPLMGEAGFSMTPVN